MIFLVASMTVETCFLVLIICKLWKLVSYIMKRLYKKQQDTNVALTKCFFFLINQKRSLVLLFLIK